MKIFYDPLTGNQIHDVSGKKDLATITAEFGLEREDQGNNPPLAPVQEVELGEDEAVEIINGVATKFNHKDRTDARVAAQEANRVGKETATRAKLGLSASEFEDLKIALS